MDEQKTNYGNWVPTKLLTVLWIFSIAFASLLLINIFFWKNLILTVIFAIGTVVLAIYTYLMQSMHHAFSFTGGGLMGKVHEYLLEKLNFEGKGKVIDIGCGSGALAIKCAKKYPEAEVRGIDYWGVIWDYAKEQCEDNAQIEDVHNVYFKKDDASKLSFEDESFDAAVSNFVFHEVRTVKDKRSLVKEALRVVKKGGVFAFHDLFDSKNLYGNIDEFVKELTDSGITQVHYEAHTENLPFVPKYIKPMFKDMGILYGIK